MCQVWHRIDCNPGWQRRSCLLRATYGEEDIGTNVPDVYECSSVSVQIIEA
jgi:hypothetical protein